MLANLLGPEIKEMVELRDWATVKEILEEWPAPDIAHLILLCEEKYRIILFRLLKKDLAAEVFSELDTEDQEFLLKKMTSEQIKQILVELSPDDRTSFFEELPDEALHKMMNLLPNEQRRETLKLLGYPENSVGRLMTPDYIVVRPHWTIEKALEHIRLYGQDAETIDMIYVVDDNWRLIDDIPIRRFILTKGDKTVSFLMDENFISVSVDADQEEAVKIMEKYRLLALPVLSKDRILLGIVTSDDIIEVMAEETTEDFHKAAAINPLEMKYTSASFWDLYKKRVGWLILLFVTYFFSSQILVYFEESLQKIIALSFFIPVILGSAGNVATQASTLVIRALSMGELTIGKWLSVVRKELFTALLLGSTLAMGLYLRTALIHDIELASISHFQLAIVLGLSMFIIIIWANIVGSVLPIILTKFKLDPAVISSPLLSTLNDATGLILYFSIAKYFLGI
ncbi:MAG TPA: magnesium transporter [Spirochaetia bacterium]|nr:MAG: magnesium transporter [Spirochaetes bacterium GWB1_36_13]HCL55728.1 magnesium transporter [Spirochaetia bacterium]